MTNSRLTDPEILETRLPVRLDRFAIRSGSGGAGKHRGGDGVIREVTFLEAMRANILANRRRIAPRGINGGADAEPGRNWVERCDGSTEVLSATASAEVKPGDRFVIEDAERVLRHPPQCAEQIAGRRFADASLIADVQARGLRGEEGPVHVEEGGARHRRADCSAPRRKR